MWVLQITDTDTEDLVDEIELVDVDTDELRQAFDQPTHASMAGEWPVGDEQADFIDEYVEDSVDLERYDYVITRSEAEERDDPDDYEDDDDDYS